MDNVQGIDNDLNAFIQIFKNFVDKYKPQDPKSGRVLNLPPEVQYFLKIWDKKAVEVPDEDCASIEQLRDEIRDGVVDFERNKAVIETGVKSRSDLEILGSRRGDYLTYYIYIGVEDGCLKAFDGMLKDLKGRAELWIFNFPAFLEPYEKFDIIEKLRFRLNFLINIGVVVAQNTTGTIPVKVGVVLDLDKMLGKIGLSCINMALSDFYAAHSSYRTRLVLNPRDSKMDVVGAAAAG
ncbi:glutamate-gated kainate-type ion channel receptor subunit GluR5 [Corchorus capsularis]|uniref:Glutamate-gated kainate-type ion channel receptor subunit GluR5 n=1 Tax=Corchorus capsularis TaxID=210143 RepID=A0A1R3IUA7_COCAP|nr:glutamate-gated kainate-type ion channel receptor subunit GluR5 [Corchorus capsularis]